MNKIFSSSLLIILTAALLFSSCKKDISKVGVDVVGENPLKVVYMDTVTISVRSKIVDTLRSDQLSSHILGAYKDPVFGTLNASVYSQFAINTSYENSPFGTNNPVLDSIVLYIKHFDTTEYGSIDESNYMHHLTVYELGDDILYDSVYYSFQNTRTKSEIIGDIVFQSRFDSIEYITKPSNPSIIDIDTFDIMRPITIPLSEEFGNSLFENIQMYTSPEDFTDAFKGLYITTLDENLPSSGGAVLNTVFNNDQTYIGLYYHNDTSYYIDYIIENNDTISRDTVRYNNLFKYETNQGTARFSNYNHYGYQDADPEFIRNVVDQGTPRDSSKLYMQSLGGVETYITFPHLTKLDDYYNYAINEAKLIIHNIDEDGLYRAIPSLTLSHKVTLDSITNYYLVEDATSGDMYFSGDYNFDEERYFFRITQYLQRLIEGNTDDSELKLQIIGSAVTPNRLIGGGWNPIGMEDKRISLEIIYTKINDNEEE